MFLSKKVVESGPTQTLRQEWPNGKLSFSCCIGLPSPFSIERMKAKLFSILYCNVELNFVSAFLLFSLETRNRTPHPTNSSTHWFLNSDEQHCMQIQTVEYLFEEDAMWGLYISSVCVKEYLSVQILWSFFKFSADVAEFDLHTVKLSSRAQAACGWAAPVFYLIFIRTNWQTISQDDTIWKVKVTSNLLGRNKDATENCAGSSRFSLIPSSQNSWD